MRSFNHKFALHLIDQRESINALNCFLVAKWATECQDIRRAAAAAAPASTQKLNRTTSEQVSIFDMHETSTENVIYVGLTC